MSIKGVSVMLLMAVIGWSGWQVVNLVKGNSGVLSATTNSTATTRTLEQRVASLESRVAVLEKNAGLTTTKSTAKSNTSFVSLIGGDISSFDWAKINGTDFVLDTSLYGKVVEVSWQGWLEGGTGGVRLYDATNHRAVDFSENISSGDGKRSFYTKAISIWRGQNQYYIEGKPAGGTLSLTLPQLKIVVK